MEITEVTELRGRPQGSVGKIREVHHFVARMAAKGYKPTEIARVINRSAATVRIWLGSPAMAELVSQCNNEAFSEAEEQLDYRKRLHESISTKGLEELNERMDDREVLRTMTTKDIISAIANSDDRTGLGRQETRVNMNLDFGSKLDKAREAKQRLDEARKEGRVLEFIRRA